MFLFKKIVALLLFPLPLCLLVMAGGIALLWFTRRQKAGKVLVTTSFVLLVLLSYGWGSGPLLRSLERANEPFISALPDTEIKWVVVLGGGTSSDTEIPMVARLSEASLARLIEGVRLHRQIPGSKLILSGGSFFGWGADAESMSALALSLGVSAEAIMTDAMSLDTETQARSIKDMVTGDKFILVTSASHMRRAVGIFRKVGLDPIPAPTHYLAQTNREVSPADFYPGSGGIRSAEAVVYEYLGSAWAKLRGKL
jgi:uncharacterized SAM-binding protein YcdF (DUF218 family)